MEYTREGSLITLGAYLLAAALLLGLFAYHAYAQHRAAAGAEACRSQPQTQDCTPDQ